jgi:hypothetical protein
LFSISGVKSWHGQAPDDLRGLQPVAGRGQAPQINRAPGNHSRYRGGAHARRSVGKRRISRGAGAAELIKFGATVTLADEETDEEQTFRIVGEDEADVKGGRLSVASPLARALIGKGKGDSVEVSTPRGAKSYEVVTVAFG